MSEQASVLASIQQLTEKVCIRHKVLLIGVLLIANISNQYR